MKVGGERKRRNKPLWIEKGKEQIHVAHFNWDGVLGAHSVYRIGLICGTCSKDYYHIPNQVPSVYCVQSD